MPPPALNLAVLDAFLPASSPQTWPRAVSLVLGTVLALGRRTVTAALRQMGLHDEPNFSSYHQVFNRAAWSPLRLARRLLRATVAAFVPGGVGLSGDAVPVRALFAGGIDRAGPPPEVADRDPGSVVVPEGPGEFLGRAGGGAAGMLEVSGNSDIPR
jgi:hypothetical protein